MSVRRKPAPNARPLSGHAVHQETRVVGVSRRIWAALAVLVILLIYTGTSMIGARSDLETVRAAMQQAQAKARENALALENALELKEQALADKRQLVKELAAQGNRLAEFSRQEEKAKSALAHVSSGAEEAEQRISNLQARLAEARGARATLEEEVAALQTALDGTRAELEKARAELKRLRSEAAPYSQPGRAGQ